MQTYLATSLEGTNKQESCRTSRKLSDGNKLWRGSRWHVPRSQPFRLQFHRMEIEKLLAEASQMKTEVFRVHRHICGPFIPRPLHHKSLPTSSSARPHPTLAPPPPPPMTTYFYHLLPAEFTCPSHSGRPQNESTGCNKIPEPYNLLKD